MRIASVSDLHTDFEKNRQAVVLLAAEIHRQGADAVIIAGDVSHRNDRIERALKAFLEVSETVAYIPGNHDLWTNVKNATQDPAVDTWHRYEVELKNLVEGTGAHYLPAAPLVLGTTAIVGSCGWYDYSLAPAWLSETVDEDQIRGKKYGRIRWSDGRFIAFRDDAGRVMDDKVVARRMESQLGAHLDAMDAHDDIRDVVCVTHVQGFDRIVHRTGTLPWEFFTSFMGSKTLGRVIQKSEKTRVTVYGHSHIPGDEEIDGLRVYSTPLGYPRERRNMEDSELIATRIGWIEL